MNILYISDKYGWHNYGNKRGIYETLLLAGHDVRWVDVKDKVDRVELAMRTGSQQVWFVDSWTNPSRELYERLLRVGATVVNFGLSDPNGFTRARIQSCDAYVTNHRGTYEKIRPLLPCHYLRTSADLRFHTESPVAERDIPVTFLGCYRHPYLADPFGRPKVVGALRDAGVRVEAHGIGWEVEGEEPDSYGHIEGEAYRRVLLRSQLGLDIQDEGTQLARRMFEYAGCGIPVITRDRDEVRSCFEPGKEIFVYTDLEDLVEKVPRLLEDQELLARVGAAARQRVILQHDIVHRTTELAAFAQGAL